MSRKLLISIHDVAPDTLPQVHGIMDLLESCGLLPVTLLVVPGAGWCDRDIEKLARLRNRGAELAGHGWTHRSRSVRGWKHRLHSALISRDAAEHLSLDRAEIQRLMQDCHDWFIQWGLPGPDLYVPPAWALGDLPLSALTTLPYRYVETLTGVYCCQQRCFRILPMAGYEADTRMRVPVVRLWNAVNLGWAGDWRPVRLGIHPHDLSLRLADDLAALLRQGGTALLYGTL